MKISSPYGYRFYITPSESRKLKRRQVKQASGGVPHDLINERSVITVSKQIDSNRVVALDLNLNALTGPQIIQGEQRRIYLFTGQGDYLRRTRISHIRRRFRIIWK